MVTIDNIPVPEGFTKTVTHEPAYDEVTLEREGDVKFVITAFPLPEDPGSRRFFSWGGHTSFHVENVGWRTFDRHGVSDSFYVDPDKDTPETVLGIFQDQLTRVEKSRQRHLNTTALPAPLDGYRYTPEELAQLNARLKEYGVVDFTPSGFGTGYHLSRRRDRYSFAAPADLVAIFGGRPLWLSTFDCD